MEVDLEQIVFDAGCTYIYGRYEERKWKALYKFTVEQIAYLLEFVLVDDVYDLIHFFLYIKTYPTYDNICSRIGTDTKTFRYKLYKTTRAISEAIPAVLFYLFYFFVLFIYFIILLYLDIDNRFESWDYNPTCIVDGFDCKIQCPRHLPIGERRSYYSHKGYFALRYVVAVHIQTGEFLWISEAYRGASSEIEICKKELFDKIGDDEQILADGLYSDCYRFITHTNYICDFTLAVNEVRSLVERRIGIIKHFFIFSTPFRSPDYNFHSLLADLVCRLINFLE